MFKTVKRIIDWCGEFKGKLYLGFVMTFFSHIFAALPMALAAYTVGLLIESQSGGAAFDAAWIWKTIVIQIVLWLGLNTNLLKLLSAMVVAMFLAIPYWKSKIRPRQKGGRVHA